jgi:hypothetical protein
MPVMVWHDVNDNSDGCRYGCIKGVELIETCPDGTRIMVEFDFGDGDEGSVEAN